MTILKKMIDLTQQMSDELHSTVLTMEDLQQVTDEMNSGIANLDDFLRPLKNYFYWEPHCFDIPLCWAFRSLFDGLDGIDSLDAQIANAVTYLQAIDRLLPQMITQLKIMMDETQRLQAVIVNSYGPAHLQSTQTDQTFDDLINVGNDFDQSRSRLLLHPQRSLRQRRRQDRYDADDVAGRQGGAVHRHPRGERHGPRRYRTCRAVPRRHQVSAERDLVGRRQDLHRRRGIKQQRHQGVRRFRSPHRGDRRVRADLPDHVVHHAKSDGGSGSGRSIGPWRAEAAVEVPVLNARRLHERMGHHRADEPETSAPQFSCELL